MALKFKTDREYKEFHLDGVSIQLKMVLLALSGFVDGEYDDGRDVTITSMLQLPTDDIKRISNSHREGRAADVRMNDLPDNEQKLWKEWINQRFSTGVKHADGRPMMVAVLHGKGSNIHIHIQVPKGRPLKIQNETKFPLTV